MAVYNCPHAIHRKLLILDQPIKEIKRVSFSDLNPVKIFDPAEPPIEATSDPKQALRNKIRKLEARIRELEYEKELSTMSQIATELSPSRRTDPVRYAESEVSISSPETGMPSSSEPVWRSNPVIDPPRMPSPRPTRTSLPPFTFPASFDPRPLPPPPAASRPGLVRALLGKSLFAVSALCFAGAIPAAITSFLFLGPAGFAVGAGMLALGWVCGKLSTRLQ